MTARAYMPEDFELVSEWATDRGLTIHPVLMGKSGFVIEDKNGACAVAMVYLMFDVPIAVVDNFITRPGLIGRQAQTAWRKLWRCVCNYLRALKGQNGESLGYRIVRTYCCPKLAPFAKQEGWSVAPRNSVQITHAL